MFQIYPKKVAENIFNTLGEFFTKDRIALKIKQLRYKYRKVLDLGNKVEPVGRIFSSFYDICNEIWRRLRATEPLKSGKENTWEGIKAGENDQPEELSNAHNVFGHDDNEGENFDDKKHCKRLIGVSINSNERQSQNKNRALNFTGSKSSSPRDETNFEEVLIEKMEQHNWTLLIARKICKKCPELEAIYIRFLSYGRGNAERKYTTLLRKLH